MSSNETTPALQMAKGATLNVVGEVDVVSVPHVRWRLHHAAIAADGRELLVDLSAVTFMDSAGLRLLLEVHQVLGSRLRLRGLPWCVLRLMRLTGLLATFTVVRAVDPQGSTDQGRAPDQTLSRRGLRPKCSRPTSVGLDAGGVDGGGVDGGVELDGEP